MSNGRDGSGNGSNTGRYHEAGPSRQMSGRDVGPPQRQGSGRYEEYEGDRGPGYGRGQDTPNRSFPNNSSPWSRPPQRAGFRPYPPGPPRARTPSPPRQASEWDRDQRQRPVPRERARSRERDRQDSRARPVLDMSFRTPSSNSEPTRRNGPFTGPPIARETPREQPGRDNRDRRWGTPREDRFGSEDGRQQPRRSFSPSKPGAPYGRDRPNPSPPKPRPRSAQTQWSGTPRSASGPRPPFQTPRDRDRPFPERVPSFHARSLSGDFSRPSSEAGPGPSTSAYQASTRSSPAGTPPRVARSVRGTSSPVDSRHRPVEESPVARSMPLAESVPAPRPVQPVQDKVAPPPPVKAEEIEEGELEEGEVLSSPVRPERELPQQMDLAPAVQPRDRWRDRPDDRARPREPFDRNRDRRWHTGHQRSPERGSREPSQLQNQPWKIGQSVDDGWGQKRRVGEADARIQEEHGREMEDQSQIWEEDKQVKQEAMEFAEEDDRPQTPPLPSPVGITHPSSSPSVNLQLPALVEEYDHSRPDTPALPSAGIPTYPTTDRRLPVTESRPISPPSSTIRFVDATPAAYVPRVVRPRYTSPSPAQPTIVVQRPSTPSAPVLRAGSSSDLPHIDPSSSPVNSAQPSVQAVPVSESETELQPVESAAIPGENDAEADLKVETAQPTTVIADIEMDLGGNGHITPPLSTTQPAVSPSLGVIAPSPRPPFSPLLGAAPREPAQRQPTLAERRSVRLPATQGPLSSPFGERVRRDPQPTNASQQDSTDSEVWPRTADADDLQSNYSDDNPVANKEAHFLQAMRSAQRADKGLDVDAIVAWNIAAAPPPSARVDIHLSPRKREKRLREVTWPLDRQQRAVATLVAKQVAREHVRTVERTAALRKEYIMLDEEWKEHCAYLDELMEKRGPPPDSLFAVPNAVPVVTPGPIPMTPIPMTEDLLSSRAIRRRGAGDAVTTEAEFQEILAAMADTAAKDPNYRASKTTAAVPDMLFPEERKLRFEDDNDLVEDPIAFYDFKGIAEPIWTDEERQVFVRRYLNFPKQFGKIAEAIPDKTASDCVLYYYRTKKEVDYKQMLASRRGVTRRKALPIKKGGKSAALLASLDQKKDTVKTTAARAVPTPAKGREELAPPSTTAKRGGKPRMDPRRKVVDVQVEEREAGEEGVSRDASEAPSVSRSKGRISMKGAKRPRISSMSVNQPPTPGAASTIGDDATQAGSTVTTPSELLPPVKRARKSRKSLPTPVHDIPELGEDGLPISTPAVDKAAAAAIAALAGRRGNTSSYWSVEEKKKLKELVAMHQRDFRAIAAGLPGKSERQISNFVQTHAAALGLDPASFGEMDLAGTPPFTKDEYFKPGTGAGYSRSIYDVYTQQPSAFAQHEPRLGVFPSLPRLGQPTTALPADSPVLPRATVPSPSKPVARSGGMRISALLNDEPLPSPPIQDRRDIGDAQSDGTVEDRDDVRPSSRAAPLPHQQRRPSSGMEAGRPDMDPYRRPSHVGYMYQQPPITTAPWQPQTAQRRPSEAYYPRQLSPGPPGVPPPRSHSYYPDQHPPPQQQQPLPHRSMDYYRQRPDPYRAPPAPEPYRPYAPHQQQHPGPGPGQSTTPPYPPAQHLPREYNTRYDPNHSQDWRSYRRTPPPPAPTPVQHHTSVSAPAGRTGWIEDRGQGIVLPAMRTRYEVYDGQYEGADEAGR